MLLHAQFHSVSKTSAKTSLAQPRPHLHCSRPIVLPLCPISQCALALKSLQVVCSSSEQAAPGSTGTGSTDTGDEDPNFGLILPDTLYQV